MTSPHESLFDSRENAGEAPGIRRPCFKKNRCFSRTEGNGIQVELRLRISSLAGRTRTGL
jgi:hypothetical protein